MKGGLPGYRAAMSGGLTVVIDRTDPVVLVTIAGEMDAATIDRLEAALEEATRDHELHVVVDADGISFVDSTGITTLVVAQRRLNRSRRRLALVTSGGQLSRALRITGLDHSFDCFPSVDAAVGALDGAPLIGR